MFWCDHCNRFWYHSLYRSRVVHHTIAIGPPVIEFPCDECQVIDQLVFYHGFRYLISELEIKRYADPFSEFGGHLR